MPEARPPSQEHREQARSPDAERFQEFVRYVERCYRYSAKLDRGLNRKELKLARGWFDRGIDANIVREAFAEDGEFEPGTIWSLGFYERTILRVWKRQRELLAGAQSADTSTTDYAKALEDLIALIPQKLPGRASLVASMAELRGLDLEATEERLKIIELQFLGNIPLTVEQKQHLDGLMGELAQRLPRSEFPKQRKRLAAQLKREGLGLPHLSLFNEQLSQRSS